MINICLGFLLADLGYDVWMMNARGNRYARKHLDMNVSDKNYWNFRYNKKFKDLSRETTIKNKYFDYTMNIY